MLVIDTLTIANQISKEIFLDNYADENNNKFASRDIEYQIQGMQLNEQLIIERQMHSSFDWQILKTSPTSGINFTIQQDLAGVGITDIARIGKIRFRILSGATENTNIKIVVGY